MSGSLPRISQREGGRSPVSIATRLSGGLSDLIDEPSPATTNKVHRPVPVKTTYRFDPPVPLSREEKLEAFVRLPLATTLPNGNLANDATLRVRRHHLMRTEVYVTLRHFQFDGAPPKRAPQICVVINPHSRFTHACFPLIGMGKNCDQVYPKVAEMLYDSFTEFDIHEKSKYRPDLIMVDDPLLHKFFRRELHGTGTRVKLVHVDSELIETILSDEDTALSHICAEVFPEVGGVWVGERMHVCL